MTNLDEYKGRIVAVQKYDTSGAWDNWNIPQHSYNAIVIEQDGTVNTVFGGHNPIEVDASEEAKAIYAIHLQKQEEKYQKENAERLAQEAEADKNVAKKGRLMEVLKGKNKGFVGTCKWVGETKYGESALLINEQGVKVFTKPHNVKTLEEAAPVLTESAAINSEVKVLAGPNAGKIGIVDWAGMTKFGKVSAKIKVGEDYIWTTLTNLELVQGETAPEGEIEFLKELRAL